jgi:hypothetical protein
MNLSKAEVQNCRTEDPWALGNQVLYDLCEKYPKHILEKEIIAKIWLIGRAYAASIERMSSKVDRPKGDRLYTEVVAPKMKDPQIDKYLDELRQLAPMTEEAKDKALRTHKHLTDVFREISERDKRSLASKYLHFHLPNHFFLFDGRAQAGLRLILPHQQIEDKSNAGYDDQYATHFFKLFDLRKQILHEYDIGLTPREIDRLLLQKADR